MSKRSRWVPGVLVLALAGVGLGVLGLRAADPAQALSNGLAVTPPMGWNDWNAYGCNVSESLVKQTADKLVSSVYSSYLYRNAGPV